MAKKNYKQRKKGFSGKAKYTAAEKRAYWIGFGRRLEQRDLASAYFSGLSNTQKLSMNFGGDAASKYRP